MFHRLLVEEWQAALTVVSFATFFTVFIVTLIRLRRMPRQKVMHMESLPLQDDTKHE